MIPKPEFRLTPEEYDAITRLDFWMFVQRVFFELYGEHFDDNFHVQLLCAQSDRIRTEPNTLLAIALPPRSLKSVIISVALPAWLLGHDPGLEIVCASYGQELGDRFALDCRSIMVTPWYRRLFPGTQLVRQAMQHLETTKGGKRYATSVGGAMTGIGADVMLIDDPIKPGEALSDAERNKANEWVRHTAFSRLNKKADIRIIIVMQRLHEDDMIGHVVECAAFELLALPAIAQEDEVYHIKTPFGTWVHQRKEGEALHPEREPLEVLERQRRLMGTENFYAQYIQAPSPPGGDLIKLDWFNRYDPVRKPAFVSIVQSWDCASKAKELSDFSVCTTWGLTGSKDIYLLHVYRAKLGYPDLKRKVREQARELQADTVLIEEAASGIQLLQELVSEGFARITSVKPLGDKIMRMAAQTPAIEAGRVYIPENAAWLSIYLHELSMFPKSRFKDQVDSTSQALGWLTAYSGPEQWLATFNEYWRRQAEGWTDDDGAQDRTVAFTSTNPTQEFKVNGRWVRAGDDGLYHATPAEWESLRSQPGVRLVDNPGSKAA